MNSVLYTISLFIFTACGIAGNISGNQEGGSSGGVPVVTKPKFLLSPKIQCGGVDCVREYSEMDAGNNAYFNTIKAQITSSKTLVAKAGVYLDKINEIIEKNEIQSCSDIPTTGTFDDDTYTVNLMGAGGRAINFGSGNIPTDHGIEIYNADAYIAFVFNCETPQAIAITHVDHNSGAREEFKFKVDPLSNAISMTWGDVSSSAADVNSMGYFTTDGSDSFTLARYEYNHSDADIHKSFIIRAKPLTMANTGAIIPASQRAEIVYMEGDNTSQNDNLDDINWGEEIEEPYASYRGCAIDYRTGSPNTVDNSCSYDGVTVGTDSIVNTPESAVSASAPGSAWDWSPAEARVFWINHPFAA